MPTANNQLEFLDPKSGEETRRPRRECTLAAELQALKIEPHQGTFAQSFLEFRFRYRRALTSNSTYQVRGPAIPFAAILTSNGYSVHCVPGPGQAMELRGKPDGCPGSTFANPIMISRWNFLSYDPTDCTETIAAANRWNHDREERTRRVPPPLATRKGKGSRPATSTS